MTVSLETSPFIYYPCFGTSLTIVYNFVKLFQFSKLYELSDEPERKEFLNKYQAFMSSQGNL